jgi:hypothetical protein
MANAPERFIEWINENIGFNPRAGRYSDALSLLVIDDFVGASGLIKERMGRAWIRAEPNADVTTLSTTRNVDLVIWGPEDSNHNRSVQIGLENKLILAAHGKARKNRLGDIIAFSNHIHNAGQGAVAAGLIGVNLSAEYANPDPFAEGMERAKFPMDKVVRDTIGIYAKLPQRGALTEPYDRPEAFGVFVFRYDGQSNATLVTEPPAPQVGDSVHYETFIERIVAQYEQRNP